MNKEDKELVSKQDKNSLTSKTNQDVIPLTKKEQDDVIYQVVCGKSLISIEKELGIGVNRVLNEIYTNDKFRELYAIAKQQQADVIAEEIIEDCRSFERIDFDNADPKTLMARVQAKKNKIDGLKWIAGKLKPKAYGDRVGYNGGGGGAVSSLIEGIGGNVNSVNILINTAFENAEKLIKKISKDKGEEQE